MKRLSRRLLIAVVMAFLVQVAVLAVDGKKAQYIGGTINNVKTKAEGPLASNLEDRVVFTSKQGNWEVPYSQITSLEYGQKAGRRVGMAIAINPVMLFSKSRKHFLTINYTDAQGKDQAVVFELGKEIVRTTLKILETRSGKKIEYQDEEARKSGVQ